jgi:hypothetical protein
VVEGGSEDMVVMGLILLGASIFFECGLVTVWYCIILHFTLRVLKGNNK